MKKDLDRLRVFLELVPPEKRVALEFRNASWFEDDVFDLLRTHDAALCVAETGSEDDDEDGDSEPVPLVATASWGYLRLRRDDYTDADLSAWAERIAAQPWSEAYVFFKHDEAGMGAKLALRFIELNGRTTGRTPQGGG